MYDCVNVEMRELLPELVSGRLDAAARTRVEAHLLACADCAAELDALRSVREAFAHTPPVDTQKIVRALPRPPAARPVRRWMDWRVAAAITAIAAGGLSVAVTQRATTSGEAHSDPAIPAAESVLAGIGVRPESTGVVSAGVRGTRAAAPAIPEISFGGGVSDLDAADMRELLGALDEIDSSPVAPAAEPDRTPALPALREEGV